MMNKLLLPIIRWGLVILRQPPQVNCPQLIVSSQRVYSFSAIKKASDGEEFGGRMWGNQIFKPDDHSKVSSEADSINILISANCKSHCKGTKLHMTQRLPQELARVQSDNMANGTQHGVSHASC